MPRDVAKHNGSTNVDESFQNPPPKLILHFDIRNTMIVADTVTSITVEQALNAYLTGVLWGREVQDDLWEWASERPTLLPPTAGTTTFYKHLEKMIVKTPLDRIALRLAVGDFVHTDMGAPFLHYYNEHLKLLEWHHQKNDSLMTLKGNDGNSYHYVLPAVYKLIQHLHDTNRDFTIIIRTYGLDCKNVLNSLNYSLTSKQHPQFPSLPDMELYPHAGRIVRGDDGIKLQVMDKDSVIRELKDETEIYNYLGNFKGICGFQDDFECWQNQSYHHQYAKPLWVDPRDTQHQHIFFDDNYRPNNIDSIVDVRERDVDGKWHSLDNNALERYDSMSLIQVDLLEAIANENYFVDKVQNCEERYVQFLKN